MATEGTQHKVRRISRYPVTLNAMISTDTATEISRLADAADWPAAEIVRQALAAGLPEVERELGLGKGHL